jgi:hypothetical protein
VSKSDCTEIINQHVCISNGMLHLFNVQWAASQPRSTVRHAHYLLGVQVLPEHDEPRTVHLVLERFTSRDALVRLLDEAVETSWDSVTHGE